MPDRTPLHEEENAHRALVQLIHALHANAGFLTVLRMDDDGVIALTTFALPHDGDPLAFAAILQTELGEAIQKLAENAQATDPNAN